MERIKPSGFDERLDKSISLLRKAESLALKYSADGFYLAFSGGKDSQALYHVAQMAGVKFKANMTLTSIDPPEVIRFVKEHYPDVILHKPIASIYKLAEKELLPTQNIRWCCTLLKEFGGAGMVCLTGIRKAESTKRAKRKSVEVSDKSFGGDLEAFHKWQEEKFARIKNLNQDQFADAQESEIRCVNGKDKILINPILEWTDKDVWYFLNEIAKVSHCCLYDKGYTRIGCIGCPQANLRTKQRMFKEYPHAKRNWIKTIHKIREQGRGANILIINDWGGQNEDEICENIFDWWISGKSYKKWYSDKFVQLKLNFE